MFKKSYPIIYELFLCTIAVFFVILQHNCIKKYLGQTIYGIIKRDI